MKLCNLIVDGENVLGCLHEGKVVNLVSTAQRGGCPIHAGSIDDLLVNWKKSIGHVRNGFEIAENSGDLDYIESDPQFAPPVRRPGTFRDFYCFEEHVRNARKLRGLDVVEEWYQFPVFYFSNPNTISTTGDTVKFPSSSKMWDFELEIGAVIGSEVGNISAEEAERVIAGYVVLNDWSARDIQRQEMAVGLGPAKGKDFATSISPFLITPDELEPYRQGKGFNLHAIAKVNGETMSDNSWSSIHYSFGEMIARASQDATLYPGDLIGSGTVGMGCLLERGLDHDLWLKSGDVVEMEIECIGKLVNRVG